MKSRERFGFSSVCRWFNAEANASRESRLICLDLQVVILRISLMTLSLDLDMAKIDKITFFAIIIYKAAVVIR